MNFSCPNCESRQRVNELLFGAIFTKWDCLIYKHSLKIKTVYE